MGAESLRAWLPAHILGLETSCDETAAAVVTATAHPLERRRLAGRPARALRRRRARGRVAAPSRARLAGHPRGAREAGATLDDVDRVAVTQGPGCGRAARRARAGEGDRVGAAAAARPRRPPARARRLALPRPDPVEPPFLCLLASGGHTLLLDVRDHGALRRARHDAGRRGRRGVRQGRPAARARLPRRRRDRPARAGRRSEAFDFPVARVPGLDFSFSGLKTAPLYAVRDLATDELERRRADLAASYQRAIVRALVERRARLPRADAAARIAVVGGVAANTELRGALPERPSRRSRSAPTTPR